MTDISVLSDANFHTDTDTESYPLTQPADYSLNEVRECTTDPDARD